MVHENSLKNLEKGAPYRFKPGDRQGKSEAGSKGGKATQKKKSLSELAAMMLESNLTDGAKNVVKKLVPSIGDEDLTLAAAMVAGQAQSAIKGNTSAYIALAEQAAEVKAQKEAELRLNAVYHMDMDQIPDNFHRLVRDIRRHDHQQYVLHGGRGSMKSSTAAMTIVELLRNHSDVHAVVLRQVKDTLKDSVFAKIQWAIAKQGLEGKFKVTRNPMEITLIATGQKIFFRGADDPGKLKSIAPEFGYIGILWFEELDQFGGEEAVRKIEQSVIRGGDDAWIIKTFNPPISRNNWANKYAMEPADFKLMHKSAYVDLGIEKEWLGEAFIQEAEHLKQVNPRAYEHEYMGEATGTGGAVFENLELREITDEEIERMDRIYQGVDFGWFPDQYAFLRTYYDKAREKIYLIDEHYVNKQSNQQTAEWIKSKEYDDYTIICDSAEPKSINDYRDYGLPARGAIKGPGSVDYGFKFLQRRTLVIDKRRTPNAYREITEYEYERDKEGNFISGYPDANDHAISALRYAYEPLFNRRGNSA